MDPNAIIERIAEIALGVSRVSVGRASSQLLRELRVMVFDNNEAVLYIPHYWARYLNDGRGAITAHGGRTLSRVRGKPLLIWFADPANDPRLNKGESFQRYADYPARSLRASITSAEFHRMVASHEIIVARSVGPTTAKKFFDNDGGMAPLLPMVSQEVPKLFSQFVKDEMGSLLNTTAGITIRI